MVKCPQKTTNWLCAKFDKIVTLYSVLFLMNTNDKLITITLFEGSYKSDCTCSYCSATIPNVVCWNPIAWKETLNRL